MGRRKQRPYIVANNASELRTPKQKNPKRERGHRYRFAPPRSRFGFFGKEVEALLDKELFNFAGRFGSGSLALPPLRQRAQTCVSPIS